MQVATFPPWRATFIISIRYANMKIIIGSPLVYHKMYLYRKKYRIITNIYKVIQHYLKVATLLIFPLYIEYNTHSDIFLLSLLALDPKQIYECIMYSDYKTNNK